MLDELGELGRRRRAGEHVRLPRVTLHLDSGRDMRGLVLDVAHEDVGIHPTILLHLIGPDPRQPDWDVAHVPIAAVEAITLHDVPSHSRPPDDAPPPPSRLEVKRHAAALEQALAAKQLEVLRVSVVWEEEAESLRALDALIVALTTLLPEIASDVEGMAALRDKVKQLQLGVSAESKVALADGVLLVLTARAAPGRMAKDALRKAIEAVL